MTVRRDRDHAPTVRLNLECHVRVGECGSTGYRPDGREPGHQGQVIFSCHLRDYEIGAERIKKTLRANRKE